MAERPPAGYDRDDKPLPHKFFYKYDLNAVAGRLSTMDTYLRTTKISVDPKTIEVNPRNASFAKDTGAIVCFDSMIKLISIMTTLTLTAAAMDTDKIRAQKIYWQNVHGAFEEDWSAYDELTGKSVANIVEVLYSTGDEDVVPDFGGTDLTVQQDHPVSAVTGPETFTTLGLTGSALDMEDVNFDLDEYFDAREFFSNKGKINKVLGPLHSTVLTQNRPTMRIFETKFVPKNCQYANPFMFFGRRYIIPLKLSPYQVHSDASAGTGIGHITCSTSILFNEWNRDFDQSRM